MPGIWQGWVFLRVEKQTPAPGGSEFKTRTIREICGGVGEQRETTRQYLSELSAEMLDTVFIKQHQRYSKETLQEKNQREDNEIPQEVYRMSLPNGRGEFILQGITR